MLGEGTREVHPATLASEGRYVVAKAWQSGTGCATMLRARGSGRTIVSMDKLDAKILDLLQHNGELTAAEIADRVGLSKTPCWRRIQKLREAGVIRQTVTLLDARALNVGTTVFVTLKTGNHSEAWFEKFVRAVRDIPEVTEIHRMSGDVDYLIRIVVPDIDAYDVVYKRLIAAVDFQDVSASFALETLKYTTALPLCYLKPE
jgi:Lrp/AsnC family transcriptional regulator